jgi:hypothetical protein
LVTAIHRSTRSLSVDPTAHAGGTDFIAYRPPFTGCAVMGSVFLLAKLKTATLRWPFCLIVTQYFNWR